MRECGHLFVEALRLDRSPLEEVRRGAERALSLGVGGFLLFGGDAADVARLSEELRRIAGRPLWMAADLERGAGQQFRGLPALPPPGGLAAHPDPERAARRAARRTARDALALGINWALAPVLDLDVEPRNPIVGSRSFSADPMTVARLGSAWIEACQAEGVAACAKHFPGHGRTVVDSHAGLPTVEEGWEGLEKDLLPFREVAPRVATVMTAHVAYPALGARGPATLEPSVIRGLLREELGFQGLVVSDAMNMEGLLRGGRAGPASETGGAGGSVSSGSGRSGRRPAALDDGPDGGLAAAALLAGCDLLLYPPDLEQAIRELERAVERSPELARRLEESLTRSAALLGRFGDAGRAGAPDTEGEEEALRLAEETIVAIGDPAVVLDPSDPVRLVCVRDDREAPGRAPFGATFAAELRARGWAPLSEEEDGAPPAQVVVLIAATPQAWKGTADLTPDGRAAVARGVASGAAGVWEEGRAPGEPRAAARRVFPIVFGHRRILEGLEWPGACAWGAEETIERAAARWLDDRVRGSVPDARGLSGGGKTPDAPGGPPARGTQRGRWEA
ncbi:MAG: glycoside hydrolase family 3 N-terminal domain-containing protein [Gemmatimonadota bacterium]